MSYSRFKEAGEHRKRKEFKAAISIYRPLWDEDPGKFGEWDGWGYAFCLKGMSLYLEALEVCRKIYPRFSHSAFISNLYAQCIYYTQFKTNPLPSVEVQRKALKGMVELSPPHREYSLTGIAIFQFCKRLMGEPNVSWSEIEEWIKTMDPDLLSKEPFKYELPNGKRMEYASHQEEWYSILIRAKAGMGQSLELLDLVDEAQKRDIQWHYNNDVWMMRKKAFAYNELGNKEKAEKILREILTRKKDWFLYADLGNVLTQRDKKLEAWSRAALERGKLEMKVRLFKQIADLIEDDAELHEIYVQHLLLIARIRMENGWPLSQSFEKKLSKKKVNLSTSDSASVLFRSLRSFWEKHSGKGQNRMFGKIKFIHQNGKSGMIEGRDGQLYFFGMSALGGNKKRAVPESKVEFDPAEGVDKKRNRPSKMAVDIQFL